MPRLSVCLIVRNEERHLPRCLESIRGLADEIVVVDTGSTDGTIAIAQAYGAHVHGCAWQDDFSAARNCAIERATGDWILALDADESIAARDHAAIRASMDQDDVHAVIVPQRHYLTARSAVVGWQPGAGGYEEGQPYAGFVDVDCRRLFQNRPWLRFRHRVHEELVSIDPSRSLVEIRGAWVVHHYGKLGDAALLRAKGEAYLRIGRRKAEDEPLNPQAHYELGVQYAELDQPEPALAAFMRTLELRPGFRDAQLRVGLCCARLTRYDEALAALRASARALPNHAAEVALAEGNVHRERGDDLAAEQAFRRALAARPGFPPASINLALLCTRQGRLDEALECVDRALEPSPVHSGARLLRARILVRQQRFEEARACVEESDNGDEQAEVLALRGACALGLGNLDAAVADLGRSVAVRPTDEAAVNLSAALAHARRREPRDASTELGAGGAPSTLRIFFYQPYSLPYDGTMPRTHGLGGTESAIVYLAEALARRGHRCVVFNSVAEPAMVEAVEYARWETMPARSLSQPPDVVVGVRHWQLFGRVRFAPLQIFWTGDAFDQPFLTGFSDPARRAEIDLVMLQSEWQIDTFHAHLGIPLPSIVRTTLGTAASAVVPPRPYATGPRPHRMAYASTPFRGLDVLLKVFPRIRAACPDAELDVFSSMRVYGVSEADDQKEFAALYRQADQPGVTLVGSLPQPELAGRLQHARVLAYPNHYAETFCIAAAEAQAAGCAVVTSARGALPETVGSAGICIPGDARSGAYEDAFVEACVSLLTDDDRWQDMSEWATAQASARYSWPAIAERWETICRAALATEAPEIGRIAVHLMGGRGALAKRMLERAPRPVDVPSDAWQALASLTAWCAGDGDVPSRDRLRLLALYFPSLRRAGALEQAFAAVPAEMVSV